MIFFKDTWELIHLPYGFGMFMLSIVIAFFIITTLMTLGIFVSSLLYKQPQPANKRRKTIARRCQKCGVYSILDIRMHRCQLKCACGNISTHEDNINR